MTGSHDLPGEAAALAELLDLSPLPEEGGLYRQAYQDEHSTAIYYLLAGTDFSALHVLDSVEVYHHYAGDPLQLLLLFPDGEIREPVLGTDIAAGQMPQIAVPAGVWQGSSSAGDWTLVGTTMAPGFTWDAFTLADGEDLSRRYPHARDRIAELTRQSRNDTGHPLTAEQNGDNA